MKLSRIQIDGCGYINDVVLTGNGTKIIVHLTNHDNAEEDIWLHCSATTDIQS